MKKVIALLLIIVMLCSVTACSKEETKNENNNETKKTTVTSKDDKETTSKKDNESESTKVVADAETSVDDKETTVNTEDETTSKSDATTGETESSIKAPVTEPTTQVAGNTDPTTTPVITQPTEPSTECSHNWAKKCGNYAYDEPIPVTISGEVPVYWDWGIRECSCDICKASPYYVEVTVATVAYEGIRQDSDFFENVMFDGYTILDNRVGQYKTIDKNIKTLKGVDISGLKAAYESWSLYDPSIYSFEEFVYGINPYEGFQERQAYSCGIDNVQTVFASNNSTTITIETENSTYHIVYDYCTECGLNEYLGRDEAEALSGAIKYECVAYSNGMLGKCICEDWEGYLN